MEKIHNSLMTSSEGYASWHAHPHHKKVHWGALIVLVVVAFLIVSSGIKSWRDTMYNFVMIEFSSRSATLTLDPKTKEVKVGDSFSVDVILDTDNKPIDGVDIYSLHYDPTIVSVVDDSSSRSGIQIKAGSLMSINSANSVEPKTGTIKFGQVTGVGNRFTGKGVLATIHFKAIGKGSTYLKFDFKLGNSSDTNVAHAGRDQLANVVDGLYTVVAQ